MEAGNHVRNCAVLCRVWVWSIVLASHSTWLKGVWSIVLASDMVEGGVVYCASFGHG